MAGTWLVHLHTRHEHHLDAVIGLIHWSVEDDVKVKGLTTPNDQLGLVSISNTNSIIRICFVLFCVRIDVHLHRFHS